MTAERLTELEEQCREKGPHGWLWMPAAEVLDLVRSIKGFSPETLERAFAEFLDQFVCDDCPGPRELAGVVERMCVPVVDFKE